MYLLESVFWYSKRRLMKLGHTKWAVKIKFALLSTLVIWYVRWVTLFFSPLTHSCS
jgi:hypothetical protein